MGHPLFLALAVLDAVSGLLMVYAAWAAVQTLTSWSPRSAQRSQLRLERRAESSEIAARFGIGFFFVGSGLLVLGISNVLPAVVPGAMCGTGVIQASAGGLSRAIFLRLIGAVVAHLWMVLAKLNRSRPEAPLVALNARILLIVAALIVTAGAGSTGALWRLDLQQTVDCCTVLYDRVLSPTSSGLFAAAEMPVWVFATATAAVLGFGWGARFGGERVRRGAAALLCGGVWVWVPLAVLVLVDRVAPYYYQVLQHRCPWCLFLPEHGYAGFAFFGSLLVAAFEGPVAWVADRVAGSHPGLKAAASRRSQRAASLVMMAAVMFTALAVAPAIAWRWRFGVWID